MSQQDYLKKDFYALLGVSKTASSAEIKKAYRKLAQRYHPDTNAGDKHAEERFKEISHAYDVLADDKKRAEYDRIREMMNNPGAYGGFGGAGPQSVRVEDLKDIFGQGVDLGDIFGGLFGGGGFRRAPAKGPDYETQTTLSFEDAVNGSTVSLQVTPRSGSTRKINVRIPAMVKDGDRIRIPGKGGAGSDGGPPGDLYVRVKVQAHPFFGRRNGSLTLQLPVTFAEAALGAEVAVPTLNGGPVKLKVPAGTPSGKTFRIRGKAGKSKADLLVTVQVAVPPKLSRQEKDLIKKLADLDQESPRKAFEQIMPEAG